MALLESLNLPLGTAMPTFNLKTPAGDEIQSDNIAGTKGLLIAFSCNHCPYAIAVWPRLIQLAEYAKGLGINTIAINSNINPDFPEDSPEQMTVKIQEWGIKFPYLVDNTQTVAKSFKAQCTPDIYLFNAKHKLAYHGRIDDNWKDERKVTKEELKSAITAVASGEQPNPKQYPSLGCSIKWN